MPKGDPIKSGDQEFAQQLITFKSAVTPYVTLFGLTTLQVNGQVADADRFKWELDCSDIMGKFAQQCTAWKNLLRYGGTPPSTGQPVTPTLPAPPAAVAPGIEARFRTLMGVIKNHPSYNPGIGEVLGIEGDEITGPDFSTFGPELKLEMTGGLVLVIWGWQGFREFLDSCEIQVDRGDGHGFVFLTIDTTPKYLDTQPMPSSPAKWTYRAIFRKGDQRVGQWSPPMSLNVGP